MCYNDISRSSMSIIFLQSRNVALGPFFIVAKPPNKYLSVNAKKAFFRYCQRRQKISRILKLYVQCGIAVL